MSSTTHTNRDPFAVMLRGAFIPTLVVGPVAVAIGALTGGAKSAFGAFLGFAVAIAFFSLGLVIMRKLDSAADPLRFLASALAVFLGQLIFLFVVIVSLQSAEWLDATAFGVAALAVALVWQVFQVLAYVRSRKPVFDEAKDSVQDGGSAP